MWQFRSIFTTCGFGFDKPLEHYFDNVLNHPYNVVSAIRVGKWRDGHNNYRVRRALPKLEEVDTQTGYAS